jgi:hypothetical protein
MVIGGCAHHPSAVVAVGDEIELRLPTARTVNAVTSGN